MSEAAYGREFLAEGIHRLDEVIVGRHDAKLAAIVTLGAGVNGVLSGGTGRGKSELAFALPSLVADIYPENVAELPYQDDLNSAQIIGAASELTKETGRPGAREDEKSVEVVRTVLDSIVSEETQVITADEITRIPTKAFTPILSALEKRRLVTIDGVKELPNLEYVLATMNARESYDATYPLAHATISRFSVGAIFDRGEDKAERIAKAREIGVMPRRKLTLEPITDLQSIYRMRKAADMVQIPEFLDDKIAELAVDASDKLWEIVHLDDGEERLSQQIRKIARFLTVLRSEDTVKDSAVNESLKMTVSSRVGMAHPDATAIGPQVVRDILGEQLA